MYFIKYVINFNISKKGNKKLRKVGVDCYKRTYNIYVLLIPLIRFDLSNDLINRFMSMWLWNGLLTKFCINTRKNVIDQLLDNFNGSSDGEF